MPHYIVTITAKTQRTTSLLKNVYHVKKRYARRTHGYAESSRYIENYHGCYLIIKIYTEDTIDIRRHKRTRNSYKYDLQAPPSTRCIRNKNTNSLPSSMYHNAASYVTKDNLRIYFFNFNTVPTKRCVIMYQF
jgi:hypothetical protein